MDIILFAYSRVWKLCFIAVEKWICEYWSKEKSYQWFPLVIASMMVQVATLYLYIIAFVSYKHFCEQLKFICCTNWSFCYCYNVLHWAVQVTIVVAYMQSWNLARAYIKFWLSRFNNKEFAIMQVCTLLHGTAYRCIKIFSQNCILGYTPWSTKQMSSNSSHNILTTFVHMLS